MYLLVLRVVNNAGRSDDLRRFCWRRGEGERRSYVLLWLSTIGTCMRRGWGWGCRNGRCVSGWCRRRGCGSTGRCVSKWWGRRRGCGRRGKQGRRRKMRGSWRGVGGGCSFVTQSIKERVGVVSLSKQRRGRVVTRRGIVGSTMLKIMLIVLRSLKQIIERGIVCWNVMMISWMCVIMRTLSAFPSSLRKGLEEGSRTVVGSRCLK